MKGHTVVICAFSREVDAMRKAFPEAKVIVEGEALTGTPVSAYIVSPHLSVLSEWFQRVARLRLIPGCEDNVFRLYRV